MNSYLKIKENLKRNFFEQTFLIFFFRVKISLILISKFVNYIFAPKLKQRLFLYFVIQCEMFTWQSNKRGSIHIDLLYCAFRRFFEMLETWEIRIRIEKMYFEGFEGILSRIHSFHDRRIGDIMVILLLMSLRFNNILLISLRFNNHLQFIANIFRALFIEKVVRKFQNLFKLLKKKKIH